MDDAGCGQAHDEPGSDIAGVVQADQNPVEPDGRSRYEEAGADAAAQEQDGEADSEGGCGVVARERWIPGRRNEEQVGLGRMGGRRTFAKPDAPDDLIEEERDAC